MTIKVLLMTKIAMLIQLLNNQGVLHSEQIYQTKRETKEELNLIYFNKNKMGVFQTKREKMK